MAKPWKVPHLSPHTPVSLAALKILRTRLREAFSYEEETLAGADIEALHSMRVSCRRLEGSLTLFQRLFPAEQYKQVHRRLRKLIQALGDVRERDVFLHWLRSRSDDLPTKSRKPIELLIAREEAGRVQERKVLAALLRQLRRSGFQEMVDQFLMRSLTR